MSNVAAIALVMVLSDKEKGYQRLHAPEELRATGGLTVHGTSVLERGEEGRIAILKVPRPRSLGTGLGALAGALVGFFSEPAGVDHDTCYERVSRQ